MSYNIVAENSRCILCLQCYKLKQRVRCCYVFVAGEISGTDQVNQNHLHLYEILLVPTELYEWDADCQIHFLS